MNKLSWSLIICVAAFMLIVSCGEQIQTRDSEPQPTPNDTDVQGTPAPVQIPDKVIPDKEPELVPTAVTIDNGSCVISNNGYLDIKGTMCQIKAKYAKGYAITVSGSMTGPERTSFTIDTKPGIPDLNKEVFTCGGWEKDDLMHHCTRQANSSIETAQWSLTRTYVMGEYVNVNPNMQVIMNTAVRNSFYGKVMDNATYAISCPTVVYCTR